MPFLTGEGNTFSNVPWRFDEYDNRAPGPVSRYVAHWVAPLAAPLPPGFWTEFDLFSSNPPVAGGGAVDPIGGPGDLGIDCVGGAPFDPANMIFNAASSFDQQVQIQNNPDLSDPFIGTPQLGPGNPIVPEPASVFTPIDWHFSRRAEMARGKSATLIYLIWSFGGANVTDAN